MYDEMAEWWDRISLRTKITGVTVLLLTLGLLVAGLGTMAVLRNYLQEEMDAKITAAGYKLIEGIDYGGTADNPRCGVSGAGLPNDYYLAVLAYDESSNTPRLLCSNRDRDAVRPVIDSVTLQSLAAIDGAFTLPSTARGGEWRVIAYPATDEMQTDYTVVIGLDLKDTTGIVSRYAAIFLFFGLTVVILGGALIRLLVTSTFTPLREVEATAARFADGDFNQRLSGATPNTEVGRLNRSLNSMLGRIDRAFADRARTIDQMRRFVGDASHELRTPLVSVRGYAELYRMGALTKPEDVAQAMERIEKEAIRMGGLVEDLLELARIDEAKPLQLTTVDLVPLANDAALDAMASSPDRVVTVVATNVPIEEPPVQTLVMDVIPPATPAKGVASLATGPIAFAGATLARLVRSRSRPEPAGEPVAAPEPIPAAMRAVVLAEENKLRQVLANLIGNAMRFTPSDSPIEIGVGVDAARNVAILSVIDHGEGIPPQIRGKIFERFWRADTSRTRDTGGSGLGLAIVSAIVSAHQGEVEVVETPGGGATFRVSLPLLPREQDAAAPPPER
jgi:two-component system OmpR family sensor kinase